MKTLTGENKVDSGKTCGQPPDEACMTLGETSEVGISCYETLLMLCGYFPQKSQGYQLPVFWQSSFQDTTHQGTIKPLKDNMTYFDSWCELHHPRFPSRKWWQIEPMSCYPICVAKDSGLFLIWFFANQWNETLIGPRTEQESVLERVCQWRTTRTSRIFIHTPMKKQRDMEEGKEHLQNAKNATKNGGESCPEREPNAVCTHKTVLFQSCGV